MIGDTTPVETVLVETETRRTYNTVGNVPTMRDHSGREFEPEVVIVSDHVYLADRRFRYVLIKGRIVKDSRRYPRVGGTYTQGGFEVNRDGDVKPDSRNGAAPEWVQQVVRRAEAQS